MGWRRKGLRRREIRAEEGLESTVRVAEDWRREGFQKEGAAGSSTVRRAVV